MSDNLLLEPDQNPRFRARAAAMLDAVHFVESRNDWDEAAKEQCGHVFLSWQKLRQLVRIRAHYPSIKARDTVPPFLVYLSLRAEDHGEVWSGVTSGRHSWVSL